MKNLPIGVFDSGIGGLTVVKELIKVLPNESMIYLGDTARVPYGNRDDDTISKFSLELVDFLLKQEVKALVVACNTMSAVAISEIKKRSGVPVVNVIDPTIEFVAENFAGKTIGLIATRATIRSETYKRKFSQLGMSIKTQSVPLLVPLIEEGVLEGEIANSIIRMYLENFSVDALILGSTHYPLLARAIQSVVGRGTALVNTGIPTAKTLLNLLYEEKLLSRQKSPTYKFYVTDDTSKTEEIANLFFDNKLPEKLEKVSLSAES